MLKTLIVSAGAALALAAPALAQDACVRPTAPAAIDGGTATKEQLLSLKKSVQEFVKAAEVYQDCVHASVEAKRAAAQANKQKFDDRIVKDANATYDAMHAEIQAVAASYNAAARAYNAAHPPAASPAS